MAYLMRHLAILSICAAMLAAYASAFHVLKGYYAGHGLSYPTVTNDSLEYVTLGEHLVAKGVYSRSEAPPYHPETFRLPAYPAAVGLLAAVGSLDAVIYAQILLIAASAFLTYLLALHVTRSRVAACLAAAFLCADPNLALHALSVVSEPLFLCVFLLALWTFLSREDGAGKAASGVLLGASVLVRAVATYAWVFFVAYALAFERPHRKALVGSAALLAGLALVVAPWVIRNHAVSGVWGVSATSANSFYVYYIPQFLAYRDGAGVDETKKAFLANDGFTWEERFDLKNAPEMERRSLAVILAQPWAYLRYHVSTLDSFFAGTAIKDAWQFVIRPVWSMDRSKLELFRMEDRLWGFERGESLVRALIAYLALGSVLWLPRKRHYLFLWALILWFFLAAGPVVSNGRFFVPAAPLLYILAPASLTGLGRALARPRASARAAAAGYRALVDRSRALFIKTIAPGVH